jgi:hypothetical protein
MKRRYGVALAGLGALTAAALWWGAPLEDANPAVRASPADSLRARPADTWIAEASRPSARPGDPSPALPPDQLQPAASATGLTAEELQALRQELASHPKGEAEFQRVVGFLSFSRQWEAFQALNHQGTDPPTLQALARSIDQALPERWQHGELTGPQALQIKARLLEVLLPDADSRQQALLQWREQHRPAVRALPAESTFLAEQARLAGAWKAQGPGQGLAEPMTSQLDALRLKSFAGMAPHNPAQGKQP